MTQTSVTIEPDEQPLSEYLRNACPQPAVDPLPLTHTTRIEALHPIKDAGFLQPTHCRNYNIPLLYCFYGRPAYRMRINAAEKRDQYLPVCFILNSALVTSDLQRILPFDSGAAFDGWYDIQPNAPNLTPFEVSDRILGAQRHVEYFFGSNESYVFSQPKNTIPAGNPYADQCYRLISSNEQTELDDRKSTIEFQFTQAIELKQSVMAVILPTSHLRQNGLREHICNHWRATPLPYPTYKGSSSTLYHGEIRQMYLTWLKLGGWLND